MYFVYTFVRFEFVYKLKYISINDILHILLHVESKKKR